MIWTDERVEKLKVLWARGLSASEIARSLGGVTRNAVIGKVHRMGMQYRRPASMRAIVPVIQDWPDALVAEVTELIEAGWSIPRIGSKLGIAPASVKRKLDKLGLRSKANDLEYQRARGLEMRLASSSAGNPDPKPRKKPLHWPQEGATAVSVTLAMIGPYQCREVVQDGPRGSMDEALMCAHPVHIRLDGSFSAYCLIHHAKNHQPAAPPKARPVMAYEFARRAA